MTRISGPERLFMVRMALRLPPPLPLPTHPQRAMEAMDGLGEDTGQTRLKRTMKEDASLQMVDPGELWPLGTRHTKYEHDISNKMGSG